MGSSAEEFSHDQAFPGGFARNRAGGRPGGHGSGPEGPEQEGPGPRRPDPASGSVGESDKSAAPEQAKGKDAEAGKEKSNDSADGAVAGKDKSKKLPKLEKATFGGGCFWCIEAVFERIPGVKSVVSGYSGGHVPEPDLREGLHRR